MGTNDLVDQVIRNSDIILIVIDARMINQSINKFIADKIKKYRKRYMYVINKIDLISKQEQNKINLENSIEISARNKISTVRLLNKIRELAKGKPITVGVVGFPNTGKSTLINVLKGRKSAGTSPISGYTKGLQNIRITKDIMIIDTPGVLHYTNDVDLLALGVLNVESLKYPEVSAVKLIELLDGKIEAYFGVERKEDSFEILDDIAIKRNILKKGGVPDTNRMAIEIIRLCQKGKIRFNK
ncbi:MAG: 50S ribosome-binding GTPase [Nanoarchaeota archaeon]|nr:50S ribosome-binding GTPase [Nanoarchaeota archaeon]